ncbi:Hypothetical protein, putative [Bodo saltans]|uniref:Uncharacterized protein n=1 Tax=Bodo saltans TaxID=75058 RepID=A0A0S4JKB5_BODSA|nr:Hypothetical protein, putative [Bodo saltans]|eukprot:CUG90688.1 Hypothetical protein, putative [Bodo saltans]
MRGVQQRRCCGSRGGLLVLPLVDEKGDTLGESSRPRLRRRTLGGGGGATSVTTASTRGGATTSASIRRGGATTLLSDQRRVRLLAQSDRSYRTRSALDSTEDHTTTDRGFAAEEDQKERATKALLMSLEEKLFERLEHHGIRRCTADEGEIDRNAPASSSTPSFEPCYFMCVPCETRVTKVLTSPPTIDDLAATMYHCSSASHRLFTRFMCIAETDAALMSTPFPDPGMHTTIDINGVRALVSTMPGGSTMFHPDPLESEAAYHRVEEAFYNNHGTTAAESILPSDTMESKALSAKLASHTNESIRLHELIRPRHVLQVLQQEERAAVDEHLANVADVFFLYHRVEEAFYNNNHGTTAAESILPSDTTESKALSAKLASHTNESIRLHELIRPRRVLQVLQQEERAAVDEHLANVADGRIPTTGGTSSQVCLFPPTSADITERPEDVAHSTWNEGKALFPTKAGNVILYHPITQFVDPHAVWVLIPTKKGKRRRRGREKKDAACGEGEGGVAHVRKTRGPQKVVVPRWIRVATKLIASSLTNRFELYPLVVTRQRPVAEESHNIETRRRDKEEDDNNNVAQKPAKRRRKEPNPNYILAPDAKPCAEVVCLTSELPTSHLTGPGSDGVIHRIEVPQDSSLRLVVRTTKKGHDDGHQDSGRLHDLIRARPSPSSAQQPPPLHATIRRRTADQNDERRDEGVNDMNYELAGETQPTRQSTQDAMLSQNSDNVPLTQVALSQLTYSQRQDEERVQSTLEAQQWEEEMKFFDMVRNFRRRRHEYHDPNEIVLDMSSYTGSSSQQQQSVVHATMEEEEMLKYLAPPDADDDNVGNPSPTPPAAQQGDEDPLDTAHQAMLLWEAQRPREYGSSPSNSARLHYSSSSDISGR